MKGIYNYTFHYGTSFFEDLLDGVYVPCINRMPGGVIVGDSGLCRCAPVQSAMSIVRAQFELLPFVC